MKIGIYPGSFDPVTNGHLDVIKRASNIFDKVIVAVGDNPEKKQLFSNSERVSILKEVVMDIEGVEVEGFKGLLLDFLKEKNVKIIIRGLRVISDFESEFQRALLNRKINGDVETVFIMTNEDYVFLNSSVVRELAMFGGDVSKLVPKAVEKKLVEKFKN
jgi:pantetheine-phosphate adenylyltransferase